MNKAINSLATSNPSSRFLSGVAPSPPRSFLSLSLPPVPPPPPLLSSPFLSILILQRRSKRKRESKKPTRRVKEELAISSVHRKRRNKEREIIDMAASVSLSASGLRALPTWSSSVSGDDHSAAALAMSVSVRPRSARPLRSPATMGNVNEGKGLFAPLVVVVRNIIGRKRFNQLRGKAIALHSQVITEFCKTIGADAKQRQGLIRLAKKNGEKLGFLA